MLFTWIGCKHPDIKGESLHCRWSQASENSMGIFAILHVQKLSACKCSLISVLPQLSANPNKGFQWDLSPGTEMSIQAHFRTDPWNKPWMSPSFRFHIAGITLSKIVRIKDVISIAFLTPDPRVHTLISWSMGSSWAFLLHWETLNCFPERHSPIQSTS